MLEYVLEIIYGFEALDTRFGLITISYKNFIFIFGGMMDNGFELDDFSMFDVRR